jgi:hypothetical protein
MLGGVFMDGVALASVIVTGVVSISTIIIGYITTKKTLSYGSAQEFSKIALELKIKQLNELYGPLKLLLEQNRRLAQELREGKVDPEKWRLLDNIEQVKKNPRELAIVTEILGIDKTIQDLIINKGGLISPPGPPKSFDLFLGHFKILTMALEGKPPLKIEGFEYYPKDFNMDVDKAYETIMKEMYTIIARSEKKMK